jgi:hypothetical protein
MTLTPTANPARRRQRVHVLLRLLGGRVGAHLDPLPREPGANEGRAVTAPRSLSFVRRVPIGPGDCSAEWRAALVKTRRAARPRALMVPAIETANFSRSPAYCSPVGGLRKSRGNPTEA